jgi:transcriptional regulator with XRE-family HTH domain
MSIKQGRNPQKREILGRPKDTGTAKALMGKKLRCIQGARKNSEMQSILKIKSASYLRYLSGESVPDARALARLADETGVDLNWLLDDSRDIPESGEAV